MNDKTAEMLGVLAHEMRTPLAAILGYQELLAEGLFGAIDARAQEPLSRIAYSAKQLLALIDGVQEVTAAPEKRLERQEISFDPAPVLIDCLRNASTDAAGRNIHLHPDIASQLPHVNGDPERFCRAIDLALAAAIKTSHGSTIAVHAQTVNGDVHISIAGTGLQPGRDDPATIDAGERDLTGAGLRLAIVRHLARQMKGDIALQSKGDSTTLLLELPAS